ncbi:hypothetical protein [Sphingomonas bacterium]|uniref:hypothetical protein n=1 Tax=Sphingomonas bacterium TaxID=1895847 RepID=UPI00157696BB|nr:hypothetical protein [Sphingomonas bacterium]
MADALEELLIAIDVAEELSASKQFLQLRPLDDLGFPVADEGPVLDAGVVHMTERAAAGGMMARVDPAAFAMAA